MNDREQVQVVAWWTCNTGIFLAGFAAAMMFVMPWLGASALCLAVLFFWAGWEMERAVDDPEDRL